MAADDPIMKNPEALAALAQAAFARAAKAAIEENDRLGIPSYGGKNGRIVVRQPPPITSELLARLDRVTDDEIDYSDIPELGDEFFARAQHPPRFLTFADLAQDPWSVMRGLLPASADVPLLLASRDAAFAVLGIIMQAERREGLNEPTAALLDLARMSAIGRIAMLDNWRGQLRGTAFAPRPYGEDTDYARAMRLHPAKLAEVIAIAEQPR
jgi:hypothetical protein